MHTCNVPNLVSIIALYIIPPINGLWPQELTPIVRHRKSEFLIQLENQEVSTRFFISTSRKSCKPYYKIFNKLSHITIVYKYLPICDKNVIVAKIGAHFPWFQSNM